MPVTYEILLAMDSSLVMRAKMRSILKSVQVLEPDQPLLTIPFKLWFTLP